MWNTLAGTWNSQSSGKIWVGTEEKLAYAVGLGRSASRSPAARSFAFISFFTRDVLRISNRKGLSPFHCLKTAALFRDRRPGGTINGDVTTELTQECAQVSEKLNNLLTVIQLRAGMMLETHTGGEDDLREIIRVAREAGEWSIQLQRMSTEGVDHDG